MISHYVIYQETGDETKQYLAEFEQLETAMDFVELYHRRIPEKKLVVRGVSYNRSDLKEGTVIASWDPIPGDLAEEMYRWQ